MLTRGDEALNGLSVVFRKDRIGVILDCSLWVFVSVALTALVK